MATGFRNLTVYRKAFDLAMDIHQVSKKFPKEEMFSMTDQIRRSSRAVCANLGEAYQKRQYPAHFVSKISDADMENTETQIWLEFAHHCKFIDESTYNRLVQLGEEIGRMLNSMIQNPQKFQRKDQHFSPLKTED
jgi:four helix bundle protein